MSPYVSQPAPGSLGGSAPGIQGAYSRIRSNDPAVLINGNQCFWNAGWDEGNPLHYEHILHEIADRCHGRVITGGTVSSISSDNFDPSTPPAAGSPLAAPDPQGDFPGLDGIQGTADHITNPNAHDPGGKYVGITAGDWVFAAGQAVGTEAVGGLSADYDSDFRADKKHQMIGYAEVIEPKKGCVFTATQIKGEGTGPIFKSDAIGSGVPALTPSTDAGAIKLLILDSGAGSLALMHINPDGDMQDAFIGRKSELGVPYYVNNYLALYPDAPRP